MSQNTADRLPNGLEIAVITDTRDRTIHMIWYKAGAMDDPEGKSGIAHYFEHLMFKGTKTLAPGEFSEKIATMGGSENAFTAYDYTAYFQRISADKLTEVMKLKDCMSNWYLSSHRQYRARCGAGRTHPETDLLQLYW